MCHKGTRERASKRVAMTYSGPDSLLLLWTKLPNNWTSYQPLRDVRSPSTRKNTNFPSVFIKCVQCGVVGNVPYSSLSVVVMNEWWFWWCSHMGGKENNFFFVLKGNSRCSEFPFQRDADCVKATGFDIKKNYESSNIKRSRRQKEKKGCQMKWVLIVRWSFQYFNHPRWEGRGDGRCYITHSPLLSLFRSLCFFDIRFLLNYIFNSGFFGNTMTCVSKQKRQKKEW